MSTPPTAPAAPHKNGTRYSVEQRIVALALREIVGMSYEEVSTATGIPTKLAIQRICNRAKARGYLENPNEKVPLLEHVEDGTRSGRPPILNEAKVAQVLEIGTSILPPTY